MALRRARAPAAYCFLSKISCILAKDSTPIQLVDRSNFNCEENWLI